MIRDGKPESFIIGLIPPIIQKKECSLCFAFNENNSIALSSPSCVPPRRGVLEGSHMPFSPCCNFRLALWQRNRTWIFNRSEHWSQSSSYSSINPCTRIHVNTHLKQPLTAIVCGGNLSVGRSMTDTWWFWDGDRVAFTVSWSVWKQSKRWKLANFGKIFGKCKYSSPTPMLAWWRMATDPCNRFEGFLEGAASVRKSQLSWQTKNDCCTPDAQSAVFRHLLRTKLESIIDHVIFSRLNQHVLYWGYPYLEFSNKPNSQRGQFRCWALHQKSYVSGPARIAETSRRRGEESCPVWVCLRMGYSQVRDDHHVSHSEIVGYMIPWYTSFWTDPNASTKCIARNDHEWSIEAATLTLGISPWLVDNHPTGKWSYV